MVHELISHLAAHAIGHGLNAIHYAVEQGVDTRQFAQQVIDALRTLLLLRAGDEASLQEVDAQTQADLRTLAQQFTTHDLVQAIKLFNQAQLDLRGSDQNQIALELAFVEAALSGAPPAVTAQPIYAAPAAAQTQPQAAPSRPAPAAQAVTPTPTSTRPAAPTKSQARAQPQPAASTAEPETQNASIHNVQPITMEEINANWTQVKQEVRAHSRPAEALLNSATPHEIEDGNRLVLIMPSELVTAKLEKPDTRQIIEQALATALGKPCRIRGTVGIAPAQTIQETPSPFESGPVAPTQKATPAGQPPQTRTPAETPAPDLRQQAVEDPVVQELLKRGGQIKSVEEIEDEA